MNILSVFFKGLSNLFVMTISGIVGKLMISLGLSIVSYSFLADIFEELLNYVKSSSFQIPQIILSLMSISGLSDGIDMILSASMFVFMFNSTTKVFKLMGK